MRVSLCVLVQARKSVAGTSANSDSPVWWVRTTAAWRARWRSASRAASILGPVEGNARFLEHLFGEFGRETVRLVQVKYVAAR